MRFFLRFVLVISILAVGYLVYRYFIKGPVYQTWDFISDQHALVLEIQHPTARFDSLQKVIIGSSVQSLPFMRRINAQLSHYREVDSTLKLSELSAESRLFVAISPTSSTELDALFIWEMSGDLLKSYFRRTLEDYRKAGYRFTDRKYEGFLVKEVHDETGELQFSYLVLGDHLLGSTTAFLLEDALRTLQNADRSLGRQLDKLETLGQPAEGVGRLYINHLKLADLLSVFAPADLLPLAQFSRLDYQWSADHLSATGFTTQDDEWMSLFDTPPGTSDMFEVIPNATATLEHFTFSSPDAWYRALVNKYPEIEKNQLEIEKAYDLDLSFFLTTLDDELGIAELEWLAGEQPDQLVIFESVSPDESGAFLRQAAGRMAADTLFSDRYGDFVIRAMNARLLDGLLGSLHGLEGTGYYFIYRDFIVFSNDLDQLKRQIKAIASENTWKKSFRFTRLMELSNRSANYSLFVNVSRSWNQLMHHLKPDWRSYFEQYRGILQSLQLFSFQMSRVEESFYTSMVLYQPSPPKNQPTAGSGRIFQVNSPIRTPPFLVRSHTSPNWEVMVQDTLNQLFHVADDMTAIWAKVLNEPIVSDVVEIDYYKNGKLQYAFATQTQIHAIDRTGRYLSGFPLSLPSKEQIAYFEVVDYDGSKNYRLMCTTPAGNIYLFDKSGKDLEGWNPRATGGLATGPQHIRVAGRDAFILLTDDGLFDLVNRRGQSYPGFPLNAKTRFTSNYFSEPTGSFATSKLTALSTMGELIQINFEGRVLDRRQLPREDMDMRFELIPDALGSTFLLVKTSANTWTVFDASGKELFSKTYLGKDRLVTQYYRFGGGKSLILSVNQTEQLVSAYEVDGRAFTSRTLQGAFPMGVLYFESEGAYQLYGTYGHQLEKLTIR